MWCFTFHNGACYQSKTLLLDTTPCWISVVGASSGKAFLCLVQYMHMSPCVNAPLTNVLVAHDAMCTAAVSRHHECRLSNRALTAARMVTFTMSQSCLFSLQHRGQRSRSPRPAFKLCPKHTEVSFSYLSLQWCNKKAMENLQFLHNSFISLTGRPNLLYQQLSVTMSQPLMLFSVKRWFQRLIIYYYYNTLNHDLTIILCRLSVWTL